MEHSWSCSSSASFALQVSMAACLMLAGFGFSGEPKSLSAVKMSVALVVCSPLLYV